MYVLTYANRDFSVVPRGTVIYIWLYFSDKFVGDKMIRKISKGTVIGIVSTLVILAIAIGCSSVGEKVPLVTSPTDW